MKECMDVAAGTIPWPNLIALIAFIAAVAYVAGQAVKKM